MERSNIICKVTETKCDVDAAEQVAKRLPSSFIAKATKLTLVALVAHIVLLLLLPWCDYKEATGAIEGVGLSSCCADVSTEQMTTDLLSTALFSPGLCIIYNFDYTNITLK